MAVRDDFAAGEVLAAADLNDTFAAKLPYSYGTATPTATDDGFLWYDENDTPPTPKFWDGAAFQALISGKILNVVTANTSTQAASSSSTFADTGLSATITPSSTASQIIVLGYQAGCLKSNGNANNAISLRLMRDATNVRNIATSNFFTGSALTFVGTIGFVHVDTPSSTSALTYKTQFSNPNNTALVRVQNDSNQTSVLILLEYKP